MSDRLVTLAIHTFPKAVALKQLLEQEGVTAMLQNVNLTEPVVSAGMRVRIHEDDLPLALRIVENQEIFTRTNHSDKDGDISSAGFTVLVPVDFTSHSERAARAAFRIAALHPDAKVVLLHSFMAPYAPPGLQLSDSLNFDDGLLAQSENSVTIAAEARELMERFCSDLRTDVKAGTLPGVKFSTELVEGVPEESIVQWAKEHKPWLIVMGTRPASMKEKELVGSVSAEVLDSCRIQALTIPETSDFTSLDRVSHVCLISTLEQEDFLALDAIHRLLPADKSVNVTVVCLPTSKYSLHTSQAGRRALEEYCREHYPAYDFTLVTPEKDNEFFDLYNRLETEHPIDLTVVPNRKKNIFARLFNPGIAHRVLFHFDIPMMVIPV